MIYTARVAIEVDVELDAADRDDAIETAQAAGLALRTRVDGLLLSCRGWPVAQVASVGVLQVVEAVR